MADLTINLSGIKVHVGMYRTVGAWLVDNSDTYVVDDAGKFVASIDNADEIGMKTMLDGGYGWWSLKTIAEEQAHEHCEEWDREARIAAAEVRAEMRREEMRVA